MKVALLGSAESRLGGTHRHTVQALPSPSCSIQPPPCPVRPSSPPTARAGEQAASNPPSDLKREQRVNGEAWWARSCCRSPPAAR